MSRSIVRAVALVLSAVLATPLSIADRAPAPAASERVKSMQAGIAWLLKNQTPSDKGWGCGDPQTPSGAGLTGLVVLALMGTGSTPTRGRHARQIREGVEFLLQRADPSTGLVSGPYVTEMGTVFDHACATLALAMAHGHYPARTKELRAALSRAVVYLVQTQNASGGWPRSGRGDDPGVTGFAWLALRGAYSSGLKVENDARKIERFFETHVPSGSGNQLAGGQAISHVAGWLRVAVAIGKADDTVKKWMEEVAASFLSSDNPGRVSEWDFVGGVLLAQALFQMGGRNWERWWPGAVRYFLSIQDKSDGSWNIINCLSCKTLATAMAVMLLQTPDKLLPLHDL